MIAFVRYTSGLGNTAIHARLRNATGQFYDFTNKNWQAGADADSKQNLVEYADSDPTTSYYAKEILVPGTGIYSIEIVVDSTSTVIGYESTRDATMYMAEHGAVVADAGNSATFFLTNLTSATSDYCVGSFVKFTSGTMINQTRRITSYSGTNFTIGVSSAFTGTPAATDTFIIINQ